MNSESLREEIEFELELMAQVVAELLTLQQDIANRKLTVREKTAAAAFLAQFYNGIENILKRISHFNQVDLPIGDAWHVELFKRFSSPAYQGLPLLFDNSLATTMAPYRRFRHVVFHSYGFQLDWQRMEAGVAGIKSTFSQFQTALSNYLQTL